MLNCAEEVLKKLDVPLPVSLHFARATWVLPRQKTYDIEVWHLCPAKTPIARYRPAPTAETAGSSDERALSRQDGVRHVHTLNGSGVAVGRALIAVMETYRG